MKIRIKDANETTNIGNEIETPDKPRKLSVDEVVKALNALSTDDLKVVVDRQSDDRAFIYRNINTQAYNRVVDSFEPMNEREAIKAQMNGQNIQNFHYNFLGNLNRAFRDIDDSYKGKILPNINKQSMIALDRPNTYNRNTYSITQYKTEDGYINGTQWYDADGNPISPETDSNNMSNLSKYGKDVDEKGSYCDVTLQYIYNFHDVNNELSFNDDQLNVLFDDIAKNSNIRLGSYSDSSLKKEIKDVILNIDNQIILKIYPVYILVTSRYYPQMSNTDKNQILTIGRDKYGEICLRQGTHKTQLTQLDRSGNANNSDVTIRATIYGYTNGSHQDDVVADNENNYMKPYTATINLPKGLPNDTSSSVYKSNLSDEGKLVYQKIVDCVKKAIDKAKTGFEEFSNNPKNINNLSKIYGEKLAATNVNKVSKDMKEKLANMIITELEENEANGLHRKVALKQIIDIDETTNTLKIRIDCSKDEIAQIIYNYFIKSKYRNDDIDEETLAYILSDSDLLDSYIPKFSRIVKSQIRINNGTMSIGKIKLGAIEISYDVKRKIIDEAIKYL